MLYRDCAQQVADSNTKLLQTIHKLWGNKAIIVLQDAGIDVSGISLTADNK